MNPCSAAVIAATSSGAVVSVALVTDPDLEYG
jgi:hypothetical protein